MTPRRRPRPQNDRARSFLESWRDIGKAENRDIRHRMFAIVDRSNLTIGPDTDHTGMSIPLVFLEGNLEMLLPDGANPGERLPAILVLSIAGAQYAGAAGTAKFF